MKGRNYSKWVGGIVAVWFASAFSASASHLFPSAPGRPPIALAVAALLPIALFLVWFAGSDGFRQFVLGLNPKTLTLVHSWRLAGFTFLVLYTYHILPGMFALPAGWGDIVIGATAPLVAQKLTDARHRKSFILWQILGVADLVDAITLAAVSAVVQPQGMAPGAMAVLPLSLIPTFAVPLLLILHVICMAQARGWNAFPAGREQGPLPAMA